jgi:multiple sugar transport system substrate-binding protein
MSLSSNKTAGIVVSLLLALSVLPACGGEDDRPKSAQEESKPAPIEVTKEPVTLKVLQFGSPLSDDEFKSVMADPVKAKYPNITLELMRLQAGENIDSLITSGRVPDIVFAGILNVVDFQSANMALDLNPMIKKFSFDLSPFQPVTLEMVKKYSDKGELYALPFSLGFPIMIYNKDIFDRFGVTYPKDGMTWAETTELARKLTVQRDGVQYSGIATMAFARLTLTMLQNGFDPKTGKAKLQTDGFKEVFEIYKNAMSIPGNGTKNFQSFSKDRTVAMYAGFNSDMSALEELHKNGNPFNWDIVTFPSMPAKRLNVDTPLQILLVTSQNQKLQEASFHVLSLLTSKEHQMNLSKAARPSTLSDPEIKKVFGQDLSSMKGKNIQAAFQYRHEPINRKYMADVTINPELNKIIPKVVSGEKDINTALREAEEAANKAIESLNLK